MPGPALAQWKRILIILILILIAGGSGWFIALQVGGEDLLDIPEGEEAAPEDDFEEEIAALEVEDTVELVPLDGEGLCPISGRSTRPTYTPPLAFLVDNSFNASKGFHRGLDQADLVYEVLVEGGITRLLAVFYSQEAEQVGPIRSARPYFINLALELGAAFVHVGGSPDSLIMVESTGIANLDELQKSTGFARDAQGKAPHNLYAFPSELDSMAEPYREEVEKRNPFGRPPGGDYESAVTEINVEYWGGYTVSYRYTPGRGNYTRYINGEPHLDASGDQITTENIVIQFVETKQIDSEGRLAMNLVGEGRSLVFNTGQVTSGRWQRPRVEAATRHYYKEEMEPILFRPGRTWYQIVPLRTEVSFH